MSMMISVDPGIKSGWAIWRISDKTLLRVGTAVPGKGQPKDYIAATSGTLDDLHYAFRWAGLMLGELVIEMPAYFDDAGGRMAAVSGSVAKVLLATGRVIQLAYEYRASMSFKAITAREWRGQLRDEEVRRRVERRLAPDEAEFLEGQSGHAIDAVGLGLYSLGRFDV